MNRTLIGVAFCFLISTTKLFAQNERIDSLKQKLASTPELESFEINFQLATENLNSDSKTSYGFGMKANVLAYQRGDSFNIVKSLRLLGQVHRRLDNLDSSLFYLQKCLPIADRNNFDEEKSNILNSIGVANIFMSKYDQALSYLLQSLALFEKSNNQLKISQVQNNIGLIYYKLAAFEMALEHFLKSLEIKLLTNDNYDLDILLINISLCNIFLGNLEEARNGLQTIVKKCPAKCSDSVFVNVMHASGLIWNEYDSLSLAENDFLQSYTVAKRSNNHRFMFEDIIYLSRIYLKQNNLVLAERFLLEREKMTEDSHFDLEEMNLYEQLCSLYVAKRNYKKLSFYQEKYIQMKDSVNNDNKTTNLMRLHAEATEKENKTQLASQEQTLQLKGQIIDKQSLVNILIGIAVALLAILIYVFIKILLQSRDASYLLNKKVLERSDELLQNQQSLKLAIELRDVALVKLSPDLSVSIESMRSLCSAGSEMRDDSNAQRYFNEISATTSNLSLSLQSILPESNMTRLTGS